MYIFLNLNSFGAQSNFNALIVDHKQNKYKVKKRTRERIKMFDLNALSLYYIVLLWLNLCDIIHILEIKRINFFIKKFHNFFKYLELLFFVTYTSVFLT